MSVQTALSAQTSLFVYPVYPARYCVNPQSFDKSYLVAKQTVKQTHTLAKLV